MSSTWKKVLLAGDETNNNIGNANLTIPNGTARFLDLGNSSSRFELRASDNTVLLEVKDLSVTLGNTADCASANIISTGSQLVLDNTKTAEFKKTNELQITGVADGSAAGPILKLIRDEDAADGAADGDKIGQIQMWGDTNASTGGLPVVPKQYANIQAIASETEFDFINPNVINDTAGRLDFNVRVGGSDTLVTGLSIDGVNLDLFAEIKENDFTISSASTGDVNGPNLILKKTDTDPADGEKGGKIIFQAEGGDSNFHDYASISVEHDHVLNNSEDGSLMLNVLKVDSEKEAFRINGKDLIVKAELDGSTFKIRSDEQVDANVSPILDLHKFDISPADNAKIGQIKFSGSTDDGDNTISTADYGSIHVSTSEVDTNSMDGEMHFNVMKGGSTTNVLTIGYDGGNAASATKTANEQKLIGAKVHSTSLEELTRRSILNYQVGFNGVLQSPTSSGASGLEDLRVANGVESIDGGTYANSVGIVAPFDGYICGGTFSAIRSDNSGEYADDGDLIFYVQTRTADGQNEEKIKVAETTGTATHPKSTVYNISNVRDSSYFVPKGTVLLPKIELSTNENGTRYRIDDLIAQFMLYTEEVIQ